MHFFVEPAGHRSEDTGRLQYGHSHEYTEEEEDRRHVDARDDLGHTVFLGLFEHLVVVHDFGENPQQTQHEENPDKGWEMRDGFEYGNEDESADTEEENRFLFPGRDEIAAGNDAVSLG